MNERQESDSLRSRFGFHPCDYATYRQLKQLHAWYWQTVRDFYRWWRWQRKLPANRCGPEPKYCPRFVENRPWRKRRRSHGQEAVRHYPLTPVDRGVLDWYALARTPQPRPVTPFGAATIESIDRLHSEVSFWYAISGPRQLT